MEYLCRNIELQNNSYIIGEKDQVLQIILKLNDSIIFKKTSLHYLSTTNLEEMAYYKKSSSNDEEINKIGKRVTDKILIRLKNLENNFAYLGLSNHGKIMKIHPILYNNLFIRFDCLLAFTDDIELVDVNDTRNRIQRFHVPDNIVQKDHRFYMVQSEKLKENDLEQFSITDYTAIKGCLYLNNENLLIEKRLGVGEQIIIKNNALVCFEKTVGFHKLENSVKFKQINKHELFSVTGPGLVIFEVSNQNSKRIEALKNLKIIGYLSVFLVILAITNYILESKDIINATLFNAPNQH